VYKRYTKISKFSIIEMKVEQPDKHLISKNMSLKISPIVYSHLICLNVTYPVFLKPEFSFGALLLRDNR